MQFFIFCKIDKIEIHLFLKINQNLKYYKDNNQMYNFEIYTFDHLIFHTFVI